MAAGGADLKARFTEFATAAGNKEMTTKDTSRWFTDAGIFGKTCNSNGLDIAFSATKEKGKKTITFDKLDALLDRMAKSFAKDKKLGDDAGKPRMIELLSSTGKKGHGTTKTSKTGGVDKMTDASQYTGAHKERFDASGKGKGIDGREERVDNTGYVGNYKGDGTFDKK